MQILMQFSMVLVLGGSVICSEGEIMFLIELHGSSAQIALFRHTLIILLWKLYNISQFWVSLVFHKTMHDVIYMYFYLFFNDAKSYQN